MAPLVTVVIPTYNRSRLLQWALDSVYAQTFKDFEVVVVDDGSTDDTEEMLQLYMERHGLRLLHQANRGPSAARNRGTEAARGKYVAYLDSDDLWMPIKLALQIPRMEAQPDAVLCYSNVLHFDPDNESLTARYAPRKIRSGDLYRPLIFWKLHCNPSTVVVRKDVTLRIGGFDEELRHSEDRDFQIRMAREGQIIGIPWPIVIIRRHGAQHPKDPTVRQDHEQMRAGDERVLRKTLEDPALSGVAHHLHANYHLAWGLGHLSRREIAEARRELRISLRHSPLQWRAYLAYARTLRR